MGKGFFKLLLIGLAVVLYICSVKVSLATSGACSHHGGVSCSAGADGDGSVICSDGWRNSSVSYSSMAKCGYSSGTTSQSDDRNFFQRNWGWFVVGGIYVVYLVGSNVNSKKKSIGTPIATSPTPATPLFTSEMDCPKCGSNMKPRKGKYGMFLGCTRFPYCKGTRKIPFQNN